MCSRSHEHVKAARSVWAIYQLSPSVLMQVFEEISSVIMDREVTLIRKLDEMKEEACKAQLVWRFWKSPALICRMMPKTVAMLIRNGTKDNALAARAISFILICNRRLLKSKWREHKFRYYLQRRSCCDCCSILLSLYRDLDFRSYQGPVA